MCPSKRGFQNFTRARNIHNEEVAIIQSGDGYGLNVDQLFYTTVCDYETLASKPVCHKCCLAIDNNR